MNRHFVRINTIQLKEKIDKALEEGHSHKRLTPQVEKDLNKVDFDDENSDAEDGYCPGKGICGYRTLKNGPTYLGVTAGGDWEYPVFFIVYWDGKKLRGYIPKEGNTWNWTTKQAYGNNDKADLKDAKKRWPSLFQEVEEGEEIEPIEDQEAILQDIIERIKEKK